MVDDVMARMGFGVNEPDSEERMRGLAHQLRGERDLGQLFQFSGSEDVRAAGQGMIEGFESSVSDIGQRRAQGLTRAAQKARDDEAKRRSAYSEGRDVKLDTLAAEKLAYERGGWTDVEQKQDAEGNVALYGLKDGRGGLVKIPGSEGLKDMQTTGAAKRVTIDGTNISYLRYPDGTIVYNQQEYPDINSFREANQDVISQGAASQAEIKGAVTTAGEWAEFTAEEVNERIRGVSELDPVYRESLVNIDKMTNAIDRGAETGQIMGMFKTLTDATSVFESAKSKETLNMLAKYKLTPVSDRDLNELKKAAQPDLSPPEMKAFLLHKREGVIRMQKANRVMEDFLRKNRTIPSGEERDALEAQIDSILHDGYDFAFEGSQDEQGGGKLPTNDFGMTKEEWDAFTPDQKAQLMSQ